MTYPMKRLQLGEAHTLLTTHATSDNAKHMKMLYADVTCGFGPDSLLCEYVDNIYEDTDKWLQGFPESLRSLTAVSKPKTAFLKLLTIPSVMSDLGPQRCFDVADSVSDSYKKLAKEISARRLSDAPSPTTTQSVESTVRPRQTGGGVDDAGDPRVAPVEPSSVVDAADPSASNPTHEEVMAAKVSSLVRVVRDLSALLDDVYTSRIR